MFTKVVVLSSFLICLFAFNCRVLAAGGAINVKTYGAKGDGVTDDSKAIQDAISHVSGANTEVDFPVGNYLISATLKTTAPNTRLVFAPGAKLLLNNNSAGAINLLHTNCSVEGATIIGNGQTSKDLYTGFGVLLSAVQGCKVSKCNFSKISGVSIFLVRSGSKGCVGNIISGNIITSPAISSKIGSDGSAIMLGYSGTGYSHTNNVISDNDIDGGQSVCHGVAIMCHGTGNKVMNNRIKNCLKYGIISYETAYEDSTLTATSVIGNTIEHIGAPDGSTTNQGMGIYIMKTHNSVVSGNTINQAMVNADNTETLGRGAISINGAVGVKVENNIINNSGRYGIVVVYGFDDDIRNNKINGTAESGIYLRNTSGNDISGNELKNVAKYGIRGQFGSTGKPMYATQRVLSRFKNQNTGNGITITNNRFYGDTKNVIYMTGEDATTSPGYENLLKGVNIRENQLIGNNNPAQSCIQLRNVAPGNSNTISRNITSRN